MKRAFVALGFIVTLITTGLPASAGATGSSCQSVSLPVALGQGQPASYHISGTLCRPATATTQVDVLTPGATYNHLYWDWPQYPAQYSYVAKTLTAGRATFDYDRLGTGTSSRPVSALVTSDTDSYVLHQIIGWLRTNQGFTKVTSIGHSLGSAIASREAAAYHDIDRLVLTGALHTQGSGLAEALTSMYPAVLDPLYIGQILDAGYLTTRPGTRSVFYDTATADPAVISYDEVHRDLVSSVSLGTGFADFLLPATLNTSTSITAPVLTMAGQTDKLVCLGASIDCADLAAVQANEQPYYAGAASLAVTTIPATGHDLTLHPSAGASFDIIDQWIATH